MRVGSTERGSLSALTKDLLFDRLKTAHAPVVDAQHMGGIMAAKSFAAVWSVRRAREHVHELALCEREVLLRAERNCCAASLQEAQRRVHGGPLHEFGAANIAH